MRELINDPFYERIKVYGNCIIDYCLIEDDTPYVGYRSHKDAILFAMCKVIERCIDYQLKAEIDFYKNRIGDIAEEPFPWSLDIGKAKAKRINPVSFLYAPNIKEKATRRSFQRDCEQSDSINSEQIPYWYAFWNTPHDSGYGPDDFHAVNDILFPNGAESLEVYEWTTDWSNYFDDGHEWWGTACWSVYDKSLNRFVVIFASTTD